MRIRIRDFSFVLMTTDRYNSLYSIDPVRYRVLFLFLSFLELKNLKIVLIDTNLFYRINRRGEMIISHYNIM